MNLDNRLFEHEQLEEMAHFQKLEKLIEESLKITGKRIIYLVRHGQSMGNHAGSIVGWTDSKLSIKGREQANKLYKGLYKHIHSFNSHHSSDLSRCVDTFRISSGFAEIKINPSPQIRELNFGDQEGVHYDSLPDEEKKVISSLDYQPPGGQTWPQARKRAMEYLAKLQEGHHLVHTHGGLICALGYHIGIKNVVPNCSVVCAELCKDTNQFTEIKFAWNFEQ